MGIDKSEVIGYHWPITNEWGRRRGNGPPPGHRKDTPVTIPIVPQPDIATDLLIRWAVVTDTGEGEFSRAEYDRLAVLFADDAHELAGVLETREVFYPTCTLCGGTGIVTAEHVSGSWADWHGPQVDYVDEACSACQPDGDWEPYHYSDSDMDVLYVQTARDLRAAVAS